MTGKQRIYNVIHGRMIDRVPTAWYTHFPDQRDNTVADQVAWAKAADADLHCIETDGFMEFDCGQTDLSSPAALRALRPHQAADFYIQGQVDRAKRIVDSLGPDRAVCYMIFTPFSTIKHSTHSETLVMDMFREDPQAVRQAMAVIETDNTLLMERLSKEAGLDGIFLSLQNNEIDRGSSEEYRAELAPYDRRLIDQAKALFPFTVLHLCAWRGVPNRMENWKDYPCDIINWACNIEPGLCLRQGLNYFPQNSVMMGGFDNRDCGILRWGSEKQIKAYTRRLLQTTGTQRVILSADCSVLPGTPVEHLRWVGEASRDYVEKCETAGAPFIPG